MDLLRSSDGAPAPRESQDAGHSCELGLERAPAGRLDPIDAAPARVGRFRIPGLGNIAAPLEALERLIQASGAEEKAATDSPLDVQLDGVAVPRTLEQREQDLDGDVGEVVRRGRRSRRAVGWIYHGVTY